MKEDRFKILLSDEAIAFVRKQKTKVQEKIAYNIRKVMSGIINKKLFEKLGGSNIWELRTLFNGTYYRLFAFWDKEEGALIIVTHGIVKTTKKTPKKEINKAEAIREEYFKKKG